MLIGLSPQLAYYKRRTPRPRPPRETDPAGYALEQTPTKNAPTPAWDERLLVNAIELERLRKWDEELQRRKRDLLHSDVEGNRQYVVDLALYNQALAKATEEREALAAQK